MLSLLIALTGFSSQVFSQWNFLGLSNIECTEVQVFENTIYLGTQQGMYMKPVQSNDTLWTPIGLQNRPINDFIIFSQDTLLVATQLYVYPEDSISLYITYDGGLSWYPYQNGFGGTYSRCSEIKYNPVQPNMLFGRSLAAVARSMDKGQNWELIYSDWGMAASFRIFLIDYNSGEIWLGGLTGYFENRMIKFTDFGDQYEIMEPVPNSTSTCMVKNPETSDHLLAGGGGGIFVSNNNGLSWEQCEVISDQGGAINDMELSPQNSSVVYATGFYDEGGSIPFFLKISTNFENSWTTVLYDEPGHDYFSNSLAVYPGSSFDNIYVATNLGVYVYKNSNLGLNNTVNEGQMVIGPNPCADMVSINTPLAIKHIFLYDVNGSVRLKYKPETGNNPLKLQLAGLPSGIYFLRIDAVNNTFFQKLVKN